MSIPSVAASTVRSAASTTKPVPVAPKIAVAPSPQPSEGHPAATVTLSKSAQGAVAANGHVEHAGARKAGAAAPKAAATAQTSAGSYVARVKAMMANNANLTVSQAMSAAGVPQTDQQQVSAAL